MTRTLHPAALLVTASTLALTLSACKIDNRPLLARNGPAPVDAGLPAPGPLDQTYAPAAQVAYAPPGEAYAYANRAYSMEPVAYDQPPEYGFSYGDEEPWAWQTADDGWMYAEPIDDGYRYYYYQAGDDYPYFVRDRDYGYSYGPSGALLALYGASGALISRDHYYGGAADHAGQYWSRAHSLRQAADRAPHRTVDPRQWRDRAPRFQQAHTSWTQPAENLRRAPRGAVSVGIPPLPHREQNGRGPDRREAFQAQAPGRIDAGRQRMFAARDANRGQAERPVREARQARVQGPAPQVRVEAQRAQQMQQAQARQVERQAQQSQRAQAFAGLAAEQHGRNADAQAPARIASPGPQRAERPHVQWR